MMQIEDTMSNEGDRRENKASIPASQRNSRVIRDARPGLAVERFFTREGVDPFEEVEWELRDAVISGADGKVFFEQRQVEIETPAGHFSLEGARREHDRRHARRRAQAFLAAAVDSVESATGDIDRHPSEGRDGVDDDQ